MDSLDIRIIRTDDGAYQEALALRNEILRKPLGLSLFDEDLRSEAADWHVTAFLKGRVIGTLVMTKADRKTIRMRQVAVAGTCQGQGIGSRMVAFAEKKAISLGYGIMVLHARQTARTFYENRGYEVVGDEFIEVGIAHVKMKKNMSSAL